MEIIINNNIPLISVIVPVYNVEKYLSRCIDSIIAQTYTNLEIILVDDGSPDNCGKICDEYVQKDSRIKVIHQENGGLSAARNAGLDIATGDYIGFVDSDDYIAPEMYESLIELLKSTDSDLAICNFKYFDENNNTISQESPLMNRVLSQKEAYNELQGEIYWFYVSACNKLYKKQLFYSIRFPIGKINEDNFIIHHLFKQCKNIVTTDSPLYFYLVRPESITHSVTTIKYFDDIDAFYDRVTFYQNNGLIDFVIPAKYHLLKKYKSIKVSFNPQTNTDQTKVEYYDNLAKRIYRDIKNCCNFKEHLFFNFMSLYIFLYRIKTRLQKK